MQLGIGLPPPGEFGFQFVTLTLISTLTSIGLIVGAGPNAMGEIIGAGPNPIILGRSIGLNVMILGISIGLNVILLGKLTGLNVIMLGMCNGEMLIKLGTWISIGPMLIETPGKGDKLIQGNTIGTCSICVVGSDMLGMIISGRSITSGIGISVVLIVGGAVGSSGFDLVIGV